MFLKSAVNYTAINWWKIRYKDGLFWDGHNPSKIKISATIYGTYGEKKGYCDFSETGHIRHIYGGKKESKEIVLWYMQQHFGYMTR